MRSIARAVRRYFADDLLRDEVVLITGGGTGIGRATAIACIQTGARVVIASRNPEHLSTGADAIAAATGLRPRTEVCDIRKSEQVEALVAGIYATEGRLDVLVNNAGGQFPQRAEHYSVKGWQADRKSVV